MPEPPLLPHPGYSWPLTHHAVAFDPTVLLKLLECVAPFEGRAKNKCKGDINALIVKAGLLTENLRDNEVSAWRDYQQVLAELGLIRSGMESQTIRLTEMGRLLIAGEISGVEAITIQALRYQYPNGQKVTIQSTLKERLIQAGVEPPATLTKLHIRSKVRVKPAPLLLRLILELSNAGEKAEISIDECLECVLPCRQNEDWARALARIRARRAKQAKSTDGPEDSAYPYARRNILDWFTLLSSTSLFARGPGGAISMSATARGDLAWVEKIIATHENPTTFWGPKSFDKGDWTSWFDSFGAIDAESQVALPDLLQEPKPENTEAAAPEGPDGESPAGWDSSEVSLRELDPSSFEGPSAPSPVADLDALLKAILEGRVKRHAKAVLHDKLVQTLAAAFQGQGASTKDDPNSIDLFVEWPDGSSALIEVKTVTRKNLPARLRLAIGQVQEYSYRMGLGGQSKTDRIIAINYNVTGDEWYVDFLVNHVNIGLITIVKGKCRTFLPATAHAGINWGATGLNDEQGA